MDLDEYQLLTECHLLRRIGDLDEHQLLTECHLLWRIVDRDEYQLLTDSECHLLGRMMDLDEEGVDESPNESAHVGQQPGDPEPGVRCL